MKIGGVEVTKCEELLVIPRPDGSNIPFRAKAVSINDEFDRLFPLPIPPMVTTKDGQKPDLNDKEYNRTLNMRDDAKFAFMIVKSLEPSNIEWVNVNLNKPMTCLKWADELQEAGISETECNRILGAVMGANALDERKIEEARKSFLLGQGE